LPLLKEQGAQASNVPAPRTDRHKRAVLKTMVFNEVADQTHPGRIDDREFGNSFLSPSLLRGEFRKMTGPARGPPSRSPNTPDQPAGQTGNAWSFVKSARND
jgi:hypothetical protein